MKRVIWNRHPAQGTSKEQLKEGNSKVFPVSRLPGQDVTQEPSQSEPISLRRGSINQNHIQDGYSLEQRALHIEAKLQSEYTNILKYAKQRLREGGSVRGGHRFAHVHRKNPDAASLTIKRKHVLIHQPHVGGGPDTDRAKDAMLRYMKYFQIKKRKDELRIGPSTQYYVPNLQEYLAEPHPRPREIVEPRICDIWSINFFSNNDPKEQDRPSKKEQFEMIKKSIHRSKIGRFQNNSATIVSISNPEDTTRASDTSPKGKSSRPNDGKSFNALLSDQRNSLSTNKVNNTLEPLGQQKHSAGQAWKFSFQNAPMKPNYKLQSGTEISGPRGEEVGEIHTERNDKGFRQNRVGTEQLEWSSAKVSNRDSHRIVSARNVGQAPGAGGGFGPKPNLQFNHHITASLMPLKIEFGYNRLATSDCVVNNGSLDKLDASCPSTIVVPKARQPLPNQRLKKIASEVPVSVSVTIDELKKGPNPELVEKCLLRESFGTRSGSVDTWVLQNLFNCLVCTTATASKITPSYIVGEGNNHQLVGKHFSSYKPLASIGFYNRANIIWTPLKPTKKPPITTEAPQISTEDMCKWRDFVSLSGLDTNRLTEQFLQLRLFKVEDESLVRDAFSNTVENLKSAYLVVREDFSIANHVHDLKEISRKSLLFLTMKQYMDSEEGKREVGNKTIIPATYLLNGSTFEADLEEMIRDKEEKDFKFESPLIIKPGQFSNRGIGISIAFTMSEAARLCRETLEFKKNTCSVVVQEYITKPLLFKERKFDVRCYALVVRLFDRISYYWYSQGYVRTSSFPYDPTARDNLKVHLTNEAVQVKGSLTLSSRPASVWEI